MDIIWLFSIVIDHKKKNEPDTPDFLFALRFLFEAKLTAAGKKSMLNLP